MLFLRKNKIIQQIFVFCILLLTILPAVLPLFSPGFFTSDDGEWMIIRFSAFHESLRDGQLPVRFLGRLNYGYGYPVSNFLYPGFMYLGELIHLIGFNFVDTIKIIFGLSMVGSGFFSYLWLSRLFNKWAAFFGAVLYVYTPYHLYDLYSRGSIGEVLALSIVPFILWQIERKNFYFTSLGIAMLILAHNSLALLFLPLLSLLIYIRQQNKYFLLTILAGLLLACFFWVPALYDLRYTVFTTTIVSEWQHYFVGVAQFGYLQLGILLVSLIGGIVYKKIIDRYKMLFLFFLLTTIVSLLLSMQVSSFLWKVLPISFIQFPFRVLAVEILSISFLGALLMESIKGKKRFLFCSMLIFIAVVTTLPLDVAKNFTKKDEGFYTTNQGTTTVKNEYMPKWAKITPKESAMEKVEISNGKIEELMIKTNKISFTATADVATKAKINTVYFPGWHAYVDNKRQEILYSNPYGIIEVPLAIGTHNVTLSFEETPVRFLSNSVSIVIFVFLTSIWFVRLKKWKLLQ